MASKKPAAKAAAKKAAAKRRPAQKDAPLGDQPAARQQDLTRDEKAIVADQGDPARRPDQDGQSVTEVDEAKATPEQRAGKGVNSELAEKRRQIGAVVHEQPTHHRTEIDTVVTGKNGEIRVSSAHGEVQLRADGKVVLDQHGVADLRRTLERAFQAVS